ncbi:MAG: glycosyltransferase [Pseudomonadota bacterium]
MLPWLLTGSARTTPRDTLFATAHRVLLASGLGALEEIPASIRRVWGQEILGAQRRETGSFASRRARLTVPGDRFPPVDVTTCADTWLALQALDALGITAKHPLRFLDRLKTDEDWAAQLASLAWSDPLETSAQVCALLSFLIYRTEVEGHADTPAVYHRTLDRLEAQREHRSGLWRASEGGSLQAAIVATSRIAACFEYVHRPLTRVSGILDAALSLELASDSRGAAARTDALVHHALSRLLAGALGRHRYRCDEIHDALVELGHHISTTAMPRGGERWVRSRDVGASLQTTCLRAWSLAFIEQATKAGDPGVRQGFFSRRPGIGFHRPAGSLSEAEQAVLPRWVPSLHTLGFAKPDTAPGQAAISVVVPCFNLGHYLPEALGSLARQTTQDFEVIVIDDGSTDAFTRFLLRHWDGESRRVRVMTQSNQGVAAARNHAIRHAVGRYICCLDPDDTLRPDFLRQALAVLDSEADVGFVSGHFQVFDEREELFEYASCEPPDLLVHNTVVEPAVFRRSAWEKAGGYFGGFSSPGIEDWDLWIHLVEQGYRGHILPQIVWDYRDRIDQMSVTMYRPDVWSRLIGELAGRHARLFQQYLPEVVSGNARLRAQALAWARDRERARDWWQTQAGNWRREATRRTAAAQVLHDIVKTPRALTPAAPAPGEPALAPEATAELRRPDAVRSPGMGSGAPDHASPPGSSTRPGFAYRPAGDATPGVTIVTPFFDTGPIFHETARSVLGQSFQHWQWLIVNDGSMDAEALATLASYRRSDPRIVVIDLATNRGPGAARNVGFARARTEWVVQLDSDNLLEPTAVEKWLWFLVTHPQHAFVKGFSVGFGAQNYLWRRGFHDREAFLERNLVDATCLIRSSVHREVGGYDEAIRHGLEDWDFWLRCADAGHWGDTLPEFLDWYRRRPDHSRRWPTWDEGARQRRFHQQLRARYTSLWRGHFPRPPTRASLPVATIDDRLPHENLLQKNHRRLLLLLPWMNLGGSDKFNLDLVQQLAGRDWEITIATTRQGDNQWAPEFARTTPDIFILDHFLDPADYPRFLRYLIGSRQVDAVLIAHSELGYQLLPYLRAHCPELPVLDFCHIVEPGWKNGGYPHLALRYQELLDLNVVASHHVREWMVERGGEAGRIEVCHLGVDTEAWHPDPAIRARVRAELGLDENAAVLLFAARIVEQKQPAVLARTLELLRAQGTRFTALVAGDGPMEPWLKTALQARHLLDDVRLLGALPSTRIQELMTAADVFFLPSQWEGIALGLYEAMASGLPVVGADVGGQRELVLPETGILLPRGSEDEEAHRYADALGQLLRDRPRRAAMSRAARARVVEGFSMPQLTARMIELIERAGALHTRQPRQAPSVPLGRAAATEVIEAARLAAFADDLWSEREAASPGAAVLAAIQRSVRSETWHWLDRGRHRLRPLTYRMRRLLQRGQ